jgi:hypothetical protein
MFKLKNSLVVLAGLTGLIGIITFVSPASGQGQGGNNQPPLNVNVVNMPTRTPIQFSASCFIIFGETDSECTLYTVPEGMRLVIEHVAVVSDNLVTGNAIRGTVLSQHEGSTLRHHLDLRAQAPVLGTLFVANHPILAFAGPGTSVRLSATVDQPQGPPGLGAFEALRGTLSGYLESMPSVP